MNKKEIDELRRRFQPGKSCIRNIYGCFVNTNREIIAYIDSPTATMKEEEAEIYLSTFKKCLSGQKGRNLVDITFTTEQVADSPEHQLLMSLRDSSGEDEEARNKLYELINSSFSTDKNYVILLATDTYDVPYRGADGEKREDESTDVFRYTICAVCPVKPKTADLRFLFKTNEFRFSSSGLTLGKPDLGFVFPAFDNREANIYNALYYTRLPDNLHDEILSSVFHVPAIKSGPDQKRAFQMALTEAMDGACSFETVQAVEEQLRTRVAAHKESKNPEALELSTNEIENLLRTSGVSAEELETFTKAVTEELGEDWTIMPTNLINSKFEIKTSAVKITMPPEYSDQVETKTINGRKYILIPADDGFEVNGLSVETQ